MFMTKFKDGSFTNFERKIIDGIDFGTKVGSTFTPKLHTIRRSARMKKGTKLSLRVWTGLPYRSPQRMFVETECTGVQKIHIWHDSFGGRNVVIDDRDELLSSEQIEKLALNDGFDNVDQFFSWFGWDFTGYIIHWHDLKY
jgi:hypothetical protein